MTKPVEDAATEPATCTVHGEPLLVPAANRRQRKRPVVQWGVRDDARRSVSFRIRTTDFGRIKLIARRLGVREADIFRYLVESGLQRLEGLLSCGTSGDDSRHAEQVELACAELAAAFGIGAEECLELLGVQRRP